MVTENTTPTTVMIAAAIPMSTSRPVPALTVAIQNGNVRCLW